MTLEGEYYYSFLYQAQTASEVAILMTLEGEYYFFISSESFSFSRRNPHDIGRRILLTSRTYLP